MGWADTLRERRDETSQFILYQGLLGNPTAFADFGAQVLLDGTWRYWTANAENPFWSTHELIEAIAPHLSPERVSELETAILGYTTRYERTAHGHKARGDAEFQLLSGLDAGAISAQASRRWGSCDASSRPQSLRRRSGSSAGSLGHRSALRVPDACPMRTG